MGNYCKSKQEIVSPFLQNLQALRENISPLPNSSDNTFNFTTTTDQEFFNHLTQTQLHYSNENQFKSVELKQLGKVKGDNENIESNEKIQKYEKFRMEKSLSIVILKSNRKRKNIYSENQFDQSEFSF